MSNDQQLLGFWLLIVATILVVGPACALAQSVPSNNACRTTTQRQRYQLVILAVVIAAVSVLLLLILLGFHDSLRVMSELRQAFPVFGWAATITVTFHVATPFLALICIFRIYRKPAVLARKYRGGYLLTVDARDRRGEPLIVDEYLRPITSTPAVM